MKIYAILNVLDTRCQEDEKMASEMLGHISRKNHRARRVKVNNVLQNILHFLYFVYDRTGARPKYNNKAHY